MSVCISLQPTMREAVEKRTDELRPQVSSVSNYFQQLAIADIGTGILRGKMLNILNEALDALSNVEMAGEKISPKLLEKVEDASEKLSNLITDIHNRKQSFNCAPCSAAAHCDHRCN